MKDKHQLSIAAEKIGFFAWQTLLWLFLMAISNQKENPCNGASRSASLIKIILRLQTNSLERCACNQVTLSTGLVKNVNAFKTNLDEKILFAKITHQLDPVIRKMLVRDMFGNDNSSFHSGL